jgi:hypothetical protein
MTAEWSRPVSADEAARRAAGRRAFNLRRQVAASTRQVEVVRLLGQYGIGRGMRARIARELGVHAATIGRDLRVILGPMEASRIPSRGRGAS